MKKCLLILSLFIPMLLTAQLTMDDFESYSTGDFDTQWDANNWVGWFGGPSGTVISDEEADSGTNSLKIDEGNDIVALLGTLDNGTYEITFNQFIPNGSGAYVNMQHNYTNTAGDWAAEIYFGDETLGVGQIQTNGIATQFNLSHNAWIENRFVFNFSTDVAEYYYRDSLIVTWPVSTNAAGGPGLSQINGINFFGACLGTGCASLGYYDDILVTYTPPPAIEVSLASFVAPSEYTNVPLGHTQAFNFEAVVANNGTDQVTDVEVTANVYNSSNTLVFSESIGTVASLDGGATATFNTPTNSFTPSEVDTYTVEYIAEVSETEADETNNIGETFTYTVTDSIYARDDGNYDNGIGSNNQPSLIGNVFNLLIDEQATAISMSYGGGALGDTIQGHVFSMVDGLPDILFYSTDIHVIDSIGTIVSPVYVNLPFIEEAPLSAGEYAFVIEQKGINNLLISSSPNIYTQGKVVASLDNGVMWDKLDELGNFPITINVRPVFGQVMVGTEEPDFAANVSISPNPTSDEAIVNLQLEGSHNLQLSLFNMQGQLLFSKTDNKVSGDLQYPISLKHLADGMYFVRIDVDGQAISRKITLVK